ncbi:MAG: type IV pilus modification protein PilV [Steroidobacteraceae bacterium]
MRLNLHSRPGPTRLGGFTMLEVLISLLIAVVGLLGLIGLQTQAQVAEFESYQRAQALVLVNDMVDRIAFNRSTDASGYVIGWRCYIVSPSSAQYLGTANTAAPVCADAAIAGDPKTRADADLAAWNDVLQGAAESVTATGSRVGGLLGARGCITNDSTSGVIRVSVAWQGMAPTVAAADTCATGLYGANDALRRVVFTDVIVPVLTVVP